ncbi:LamG-like jellyroll fold domain-containing protein [uncultured Shewanella sp.]|uniref:LamG-like jellyroll fold domain-containing protein n=1 Tax=uncultured Shewanella sp. TaxID=173975 RepID=UPI00260B995F|nr:LamG-like jellyroll fold domain-containing protein [uncultured Shewanella sp.]
MKPFTPVFQLNALMASMTLCFSVWANDDPVVEEEQQVSTTSSIEKTASIESSTTEVETSTSTNDYNRDPHKTNNDPIFEADDDDVSVEETFIEQESASSETKEGSTAEADASTSTNDYNRDPHKTNNDPILEVDDDDVSADETVIDQQVAPAEIKEGSTVEEDASTSAGDNTYDPHKTKNNEPINNENELINDADDDSGSEDIPVLDADDNTASDDTVSDDIFPGEDDTAVEPVAASLDSSISTGAALGLMFNGNNQYGVISTNGAFDPTQSFTVETWFKTDSLANKQHIVQQQDGSGTGRTIIGIRTSGQVYSYLGGSNLNSSVNIQAGDWHHVAVSFDSASRQLSMLLDGVEVATRTVDSNNKRGMEFSDGDLVLGANKKLSGSFFTGLMDETRVWQRALTQAELQVGKHMSVDPADPDLLMHFTYDEAIRSEVQNNWNNDDRWSKATYTLDYLYDNADFYRLALYNGVEATESRNHALLLDGDGDYVEIPHADTLNMNAFTVQAWVYLDKNSEGDYRNIVAKKPGTGTLQGWVLRLRDTLVPEFFMADGRSTLKVTGNSVLEKQTWYHLAASITSGTSKAENTATLYVNGVKVASKSSYNSTSKKAFDVNSDAPLRLGTWSGDIDNADYFMGQMDGVAMWNTVMAENDFILDRTVSLTGSDNLVAYYPFESTQLNDFSGNQHDGQYFGDAVTTTHALDNHLSGEGELIGYLANPDSLEIEVVQAPSQGNLVMEAVADKVIQFTFTPTTQKTNKWNDRYNTVTDSFDYRFIHPAGDFSVSERVSLVSEYNLSSETNDETTISECCVDAWVATGTEYQVGDIVYHDGKTWEAQDRGLGLELGEPGTTSEYYWVEVDSPCPDSDNTSVAVCPVDDCSVDEWAATTEYSRGDIVMYEGKTWEAQDSGLGLELPLPGASWYEVVWIEVESPCTDGTVN